ncbi:hypothetical protein BDQ94DRAFT_133335 [Aspergillus welwitschiae]|uniref:Uncharacterized protein n=1 Tax=Aspergillus welwitschiae TaxID=1341132 RepID=A0A3F3QK18_9EURO|nr:hypothetical protein BDQ94DRAFT_133335 [Aspergillus welwitschiae]RDH39598.1 hypothetical protein BDQ94DRAFT_133335 [Aspergillus welwitschiae]
MGTRLGGIRSVASKPTSVGSLSSNVYWSSTSSKSSKASAAFSSSLASSISGSSSVSEPSRSSLTGSGAAACSTNTSSRPSTKLLLSPVLAGPGAFSVAGFADSVCSSAS